MGSEPFFTLQLGYAISLESPEGAAISTQKRHSIPTDAVRGLLGRAPSGCRIGLNESTRAVSLCSKEIAGFIRN